MSSQKKILVIRFSSIGDIVLTTPVIRAIKKHGGHEIHALTKKQNRGLYENNPSVTRVFSFELSISEILPDLVEENYDFVIDLQKNLRSSKIRRKLKSTSYTFPKLNIEKWLLVNLKINKLPGIHIVDRYFKAVETLGIENDKKGLEFHIPPDDELAPELIDERLRDGYIAFVIGGQHYTKILPAEKASEIINGIDLPVVLLGGPDDKARGDEIRKLCPDSVIFNTCGEFNINQSASLVQLSDVVITNDTGLMHIASAFGKPTISIWGNTVPEFGMYPYFPDSPEKYYLSEVKGLSCRPCSKIGHKKCPKKHFKCMMDQNTEKILEKLNKIKGP